MKEEPALPGVVNLLTPGPLEKPECLVDFLGEWLPVT